MRIGKIFHAIGDYFDRLYERLHGDEHAAYAKVYDDTIEIVEDALLESAVVNAKIATILADLREDNPYGDFEE